MNEEYLFLYKATVINVYDGDTITCNIDCGFGVILKNQKIRLYGIDTPELRGEDKKEGLEIRNILRDKILNKEILLKTIKDKKGKYGRWLGIIFFDNQNINDWLIENNYAEKYI